MSQLQLSGEEQSRRDRLRAKAAAKFQRERAESIAALKGRNDYHLSFDYFLNLLSLDQDPQSIEARVGRKVVVMMCLQAPLELFSALSLHPLRLLSGSTAAAFSAPPELPALMCPLIRSLAGRLEIESSLVTSPWIVPTTCDWVTGFQALAKEYYPNLGPVHFLELPRRKESELAAERWLEEVRGLWEYLKKLTKNKAGRKDLLDAISVFQKVRGALGRLSQLRRSGKVPAVWWFVFTAAFFLDSPQAWTEATERVCDHFSALTAADGPGIFLTGSPLVFPNFKLLNLIEQAGLKVLGDDMCSGERLLSRHIAVTDTSLEGLLSALARAAHDGCLCPVFTDNHRRMGPINEAVTQAPVKGVVFHFLKGCHPYDLDSLSLEFTLKEKGLRFIKLETDYTLEDQATLRTRLEAFKASL
jgi:benzoyl-CoA reductase/2-hydroxyglutaryl-CoA dehydratase subunit BcrC/BadD/HgdB